MPRPQAPKRRRASRAKRTSHATRSRKAAGTDTDTKARRANGKTSRPRPDSATGKLRFKGISARAWEHPADRAALTAMRKVPGFDRVLKALFREVGDRSLRLAYLASAVRVTPRQFPDLHARHLEACAILDLDPPPELFVSQTPLVNAGAVGIGRPFLVLNSGSLALLDGDEQSFLLGHELGHVLSGHVLYKTMLAILLRMTVLATSVPLGGAALFAITAAMLEWSRRSELSADRAGLLVVQSPEVAMRVHMKMAGGGRTSDMSLAEFLAQADEYAGQGNVLDSLMKLLRLTGATHPFPVLRLAELKKWVDSGEYGRLATEGYPLRAEDDSASVAGELASGTASYRSDFASSRDPLARILREFGDKARGMTSGVLSWVRARRERETGTAEAPPGAAKRPRKKQRPRRAKSAPAQRPRRSR